MFVVMIKVATDCDLDAIKDVLEDAAEEGVIQEAFDLSVEEVPE